MLRKAGHRERERKEGEEIEGRKGKSRLERGDRMPGVLYERGQGK